MLPFYKEFDDLHDESSPINNYCMVVYEFLRVGNTISVKFRQYYEEAYEIGWTYEIGWIDPAELTVPTFVELVRKQDQRQTLLAETSLQLPSMDVTRSLQGV